MVFHKKSKIAQFISQRAFLLLLVLYLSFISLGLPDSLLGSAWPVMQSSLQTSFAMAGVLAMVTISGTIISSFFSGFLLKRFGTFRVTLFSTLLTTLALFGFANASNWYWLWISALPLGFGGGAIDAALNHYVAANYRAHHMNWLHCSWGIGASVGPLIMSYAIEDANSWKLGYLMVAIIQIGVLLVLLISAPLWARITHEQANQQVAEHADDATPSEAGLNDTQSNRGLRLVLLPGVRWAMISFFLYVGIEVSFGLWGSSFLVAARGIDAVLAAQAVAVYFGSITVGRALNGVFSFRWSNQQLMFAGLVIAVLGAVTLGLPLSGNWMLLGFVLAGFGLAPFYPGMMHETPVRFGKAYAQELIGFQTAAASLGCLLLPPLLGWLALRQGIGIMPMYTLAGLLLLIVCLLKLRATSPSQ